MYWDISLHIDNGRDPGPLANPAHYFILAGLFGIFTAGFIAIVLPRERPSEVAIRLGRDWWAPLGGVLICACGAFSLIGFPLDDVWHRLFGQDVTLWGPTHLMLIGGAAMTLVGIAVLTVEGLRANDALERTGAHLTTRMRAVALTGGLMVGLSTFQAEFDFGVPQFQLIFQPMLLMLAAGLGLVLARVYAGRGAALGAVAFFIVIRGGLSLLVGPLLGQTMPHFPLYIVEALVVEAVALWVPTGAAAALRALVGAGDRHRRPRRRVGLVAGLDAAALARGDVPRRGAARLGRGARRGDDRRLDRLAPRGRAAQAAAGAAGGRGLQRPGPGRAGRLRPQHLDRAGSQRAGGPARGQRRTGPQVQATVALQPADAAEGAEWFDLTAWQGGGLVVDRLEQIGPGRYRTTEPIPVSGSWKTMVRLHKGNSLTALPIYLPRDAAIPVGEIPAADASPASSATSTNCCSASKRAAARPSSRSPTRSSSA